MTQGSIIRHLIAFTLPLILGNFFQMTYHAADSIIVGRLIGEEALAAVGTAEPVMDLLILGISGLCVGVSVIMSQLFGAGEYDKLRRELGISLKLCMAFALAVTALSVAFAPVLLTALQVPEQILGPAVLYLRIVMVGMPFTCLYNVYAAALRSVGDSKTPLFFLTLTSILNIVLDLAFIALLHAGVMGAAVATMMAQMISAVLCVIHTSRKVPLLALRAQDFAPEPALMRKTLRYGVITAFQQCAQPVGKLLIQGMVNTLGVSAIAAYNVVGRIEEIVLLPERSIGNAMMTFTAQNRGAKEDERVRKGLFAGMALEVGCFALVAVIIAFFHKPLLMLFGKSESILAEGSAYFTSIVLLYWLPGLTNGAQGYIRGQGHMKLSLCGTLTQISFRVIFTALLIGHMGIRGIAYACCIGWSIMLVVLGVSLSVLEKRANAPKR